MGAQASICPCIFGFLRLGSVLVFLDGGSTLIRSRLYMIGLHLEFGRSGAPHIYQAPHSMVYDQL